MPFFIRIEQPQDLEFLQSLMSNAVTKLKRGNTPIDSASEQIIRLHECVFSAVPMKEASDLGITDEFKEEKKPKAKPAESHDLCATHPKYGAKRAPKTPCKGCWAAYKKLNPLSYDLAKRKFERTQSA